MKLGKLGTELGQWYDDRKHDREKKKAGRKDFWNDVEDDTKDALGKVASIFGGSSSSKPASHNASYPGQAGSHGYGNQQPYPQAGYTDPNTGTAYGGYQPPNQYSAASNFPGQLSVPGSGYEAFHQQGAAQPSAGSYSQPYLTQPAHYQAPTQQYDPSLYGNQQPQQPQQSFNTGQPYDYQPSYSQGVQQPQQPSALSGSQALNLPNSPFSVSQPPSPVPSHHSYNPPPPQQGYTGQTDYSQAQQQYQQGSNYLAPAQPQQYGHDTSGAPSAWGDNPTY